MAAAPIKVWTDGEDLLLGDLNNEISNIYSEINNISGTNIVDGSITPAKLSDGANPQVYFGEIFGDEIVISGLDEASNTGLTITVNAGTAYILKDSTSPDKLVRVVRTLPTTLGLTASITQWVHLTSAGAFVVNTAGVLIDAITLLKVTTDGSSVTAVVDVRDTDFLEDANIARNYHDNVLWEITSTTEVIIRSGTHFRDFTNTKSFTFDADQTIDITVVGENGIDQGTVGANKFYVLVAIADPDKVTPPRGLLVEKANFRGSMILPTAGWFSRRIGYLRTDGSSNLIPGEYLDERFHYDDAQQVLTAGASATYAGVSCSSFVPPDLRSAVLYGNQQTGAGSGSTQWRTTGNGSTGKEWASFGSETSGYGGVFLLNSSQSIDYKVSTGTFDIWVDGWVDKLDKDT